MERILWLLSQLSVEVEVKLDMDAAVSAAQRAASEAERVIRDYLSSGQWSVTVKPDDTPVTEVDVAVEKAIHTVLADALPEAGFFGEETGRSEGTGDGRWQWLVDPIDGTKSFIRGLPFYSTQIALQVDQTMVVGVSNAPAYEQRLVGIQGRGAWLNDQPVRTRSDISSVDNAFLSTGNLTSLAMDNNAWMRFGKLVSRVRRVRGYGDFCHYHQLCCGQTDLIIESDVNILDIAALSVAVREAGGVITDMQGKAIELNTTSVIAAGCQALHNEALDMISG